MKLPIIWSVVLFVGLQSATAAETTKSSRTGIALSVDAGVVALGGIGTQASWYFWPGEKKGFYLSMIYH